MHADLPTLAFFADQVACGDTAVFEDQVGGGRTTDAHLLFMQTGGEAGGALFNDEQGDALQTLGLIGNCENDIGRSGVTIGDEALGAVQDVFVTVLDSDGLLAGSVSTCAGFSQAECTDLTAGSQIGDPLHLLLFGAESHDGAHAQRGVSSNDNGRSSALLGDFFDGDTIHQVVAAGSAVFLGDGNTHDAIASKLFNAFPRETFFFVDLYSQGFKFILCEFAEHLTSHFMFFAQFKVHI